MAKRTLIVLEIRDDNTEREWHDALGLPKPWSWNEIDPCTFPPNDDVYVTIIHEAEVK